jgi:hypothetical protein
MKTMRLVSVAVLVLLVGGTRAQEDFPKPGPEHAQLKQMTGVWDGLVKCHLPKPMESKGEYTAKMDLGGFFLATEFKCELFGAPFHGRGFNGYDPFKKKYVGVWVDSMSPAIYTIEGAFDKSGKVFTETMEGPDPKGKPMKMRAVTQIKSKDQMHFQMFVPGEDGKDALMMEVVYTRRK